MRTTLALALSALSLGATLAAAGWLVPSEGLPGHLIVPAQRVGDSGEYEITFIGPDGKVTDHHVALRFAWRPVLDLRVADGTVRTANQLDVETLVRLPDGGLVSRNTTYYWDAEDADVQLGARTRDLVVDDIAIVGLPMLGTPVTTDVSRLVLSHPGEHGGGAEPCGPLTKPGRLDLRQRQPLTWACTTGLRVLGAPSFVAVGRQDLEGIPTVVFAERHLACCAHAWLSEDLPYLVQMSDRDAHGREAVLRLVRFERGTGPFVATRNQAEADPLPPRADAATPRWGPDDAGRGPFPLAAAFARAREDPAAPELRDWLAAHPQAYLAEASGRTVTRGGVDSVTWRFVVADGDDALAVGITRHAPYAGGSPFGIVFSTGATYTYENHTLAKDAWYPAFHDIRPTFPTVDWLVARWHAFGGEGPATSWGFRHSCLDEACTFVNARAWAGVAHYEVQGASLPLGAGVGAGPAAVDVRYIEETSARLRADTGSLGSPPGVALVDLRRVPGMPRPDLAALTPGTTAASPAPAGGWEPPSNGAWVAAGGVALLAFLAVRFGGALLGLPLFSRIQGPDLLENPLRRSIHQAVEANPGIHLKALARTLGRPRGTVEHHVRKLVAGGLVAQHELNGYACLFVKGQVDRRAQAAAGALKSDTARKVLATVVASPGASGRAVAAQAGLAPTLVSYHAQNLVKAGLLEGQRTGRELRLTPTELGRQATS